MIWVSLSYLCLGAHFVIFPNVIVQVFGLRSGVTLSSFIYSTRCISALGGLFISKALVEQYGEDSYTIMFYASCVFIVLVIIV